MKEGAGRNFEWLLFMVYRNCRLENAQFYVLLLIINVGPFSAAT